MILVLFFVIILLIIPLVIAFSYVQVEIKNLEIANKKINKKDVSTIATNTKKEVDTKYTIKISLYFMNKIKYFSINLNNTKVRKIYRKMHLDRIDIKKIEKDLTLSELKELLKIKPYILRLNLKINIGVDDVILTTYIIPIICTILSIIVAKSEINNNQDYKSRNNLKYIVEPLYNQGNIYYIYLNTILKFKILNLLRVGIRIYKLNKIEKQKQNIKMENNAKFSKNMNYSV